MSILRVLILLLFLPCASALAGGIAFSGGVTAGKVCIESLNPVDLCWCAKGDWGVEGVAVRPNSARGLAGEADSYPTCNYIWSRDNIAATGTSMWVGNFNGHEDTASTYGVWSQCWEAANSGAASWANAATVITDVDGRAAALGRTDSDLEWDAMTRFDLLYIQEITAAILQDEATLDWDWLVAADTTSPNSSANLYSDFTTFFSGDGGAFCTASTDPAGSCNWNVRSYNHPAGESTTCAAGSDWIPIGNSYDQGADDGDPDCWIDVLALLPNAPANPHERVIYYVNRKDADGTDGWFETNALLANQGDADYRAWKVAAAAQMIAAGAAERVFLNQKFNQYQPRSGYKSWSTDVGLGSMVAGGYPMHFYACSDYSALDDTPIRLNDASCDVDTYLAAAGASTPWSHWPSSCPGQRDCDYDYSEYVASLDLLADALVAAGVPFVVRYPTYLWQTVKILSCAPNCLVGREMYDHPDTATVEYDTLIGIAKKADRVFLDQAADSNRVSGLPDTILGDFASDPTPPSVSITDSECGYYNPYD